MAYIFTILPYPCEYSYLVTAFIKSFHVYSDIRPTDPAYKSVLKKYCWYHLPGGKALAQKPVLRSSDMVQPAQLTVPLSRDAVEGMLYSAGRFEEEKRLGMAEQLYKRILIESPDEEARCIKAYGKLLKRQHRDREFSELERLR